MILADEHNIPEDDLTYDGVKKLLLNDSPGIDLMFSKELAFCLPESMYDEITRPVGISLQNLLTRF